MPNSGGAKGVKKVKPYPFAATLDINGQKKPVEVIYISPAGMLIDLNTQIVSVGEYYQIEFEIPVLKFTAMSLVRVIKTYDRSLDPKEKKVQRVAELHFQNLTQELKSRIVAFNTAIGQEK